MAVSLLQVKATVSASRVPEVTYHPKEREVKFAMASVHTSEYEILSSRKNLRHDNVDSCEHSLLHLLNMMWVLVAGRKENGSANSRGHPRYHLLGLW